MKVDRKTYHGNKGKSHGVAKKYEETPDSMLEAGKLVHQGAERLWPSTEGINFRTEDLAVEDQAQGIWAVLLYFLKGIG